MTLWGVLITGLVAGGASCAAVQGGLLAGLIAKRKAPLASGSGYRAKHRARGSTKVIDRPGFSGPEDLSPVGGFLAAKLVSHTLLGALLGLLGQRIQVGFRLQATAQIVAGALMLLMALDLFGVAWVRRLIPTPPASWTALVRSKARSSTALAPAALGFFTVLIPCGVTLSMELLAISSGSALSGALIMAVFVIGTSPLFAFLGYAVRRAGSIMGANVGKLAAVVVTVVGLITINSGLVVAGSPLRLSSLLAGTGQPSPSIDFSQQAAAAQAVVLPDSSSGQSIVLAVSDYGYSPATISAQAGVPTKLVLKTNGTIGCTRAFVIPDLGIQKVLPQSGETEIDLGKLRAGEILFTCSMGMYSGQIDVS